SYFRGRAAGSMSDEIDALLQKAQRRLQAGASNFSGAYFEDVAEDAYLAMYYAASALILAEPDLEKFSTKHQFVSSEFGRRFAKTGRVDRKLGRYLHKAFEKRNAGLYEVGDSVSREDAEEQLQRATEFVTKANQFMKGAGGDLE
ncbi:MAG TPA: HEPN domain-containing protein, partial [Terriglobia bacterium]|nr:HEPN domain-containing protein [Terriglobia bacterium]